jgi:uncharacterized protein
MEAIYSTYYQLLKRTNIQFVRSLSDKIDWNNRLIAITGARGCGKTTLLLQHIRLKWGVAPEHVLYASLDHLWFSSNSLFDFADAFVKRGGQYLFLDEVHKYQNWSQEIKNIYDSFPELYIVITGSSMLQIYKGNADLSRRAVHYRLNGLSFREYLHFEHNFDSTPVSIEDLLVNHLEIAQQVCATLKPIPLFENYLKTGYYPFFRENLQLYYHKLLNTVNAVLEIDLPAVERIDYYSIHKMKKLLYIISSMVPFSPNITRLSAEMEVSRNSLLNYLSLLERASTVNLLGQDVSGLQTLTKPEKIYLDNPNLCYALSTDKYAIGNVRETFFFNQLKAVASVTSVPKGDFLVNEKYTFEVGGKSKGFDQIAGIADSYLAIDDIETGLGNKIPLWLFGFLY